MEYSKAKTLKVGDRVIWDGSKTDQGTVSAIGLNGVKIKWDDGQEAWIAFYDMPLVRRAPLKGEQA